jgi:hypothetical protein
MHHPLTPQIELALGESIFVRLGVCRNVARLLWISHDHEILRLSQRGDYRLAVVFMTEHAKVIDRTCGPRCSVEDFNLSDPVKPLGQQMFEPL